jgi:hypothetical protein
MREIKNMGNTESDGKTVQAGLSRRRHGVRRSADGVPNRARDGIDHRIRLMPFSARGAESALCNRAREDRRAGQPRPPTMVIVPR